MIATRAAIAAGVAAVGLLCWLAVDGVAVATELLVSAVALCVLVGGGNWLAGHLGRPGAGPPPPGGGRPTSGPEGQGGAGEADR